MTMADTLNDDARMSFKEFVRTRGNLSFLLLVPAQIWVPYSIKMLESGAPLTFEIMYFVEGLTLILISGYVHMTKNRHRRSGRVAWFAATIFALAPVMYFLSLRFSLFMHPAFPIVCAATVAVARMWFYVESIAVLSKLDTNRASGLVLVSFIIAPIIRILLEAVPLQYILPLIASIPFIFVFMRMRCISQLEEGAVGGDSVSSSQRTDQNKTVVILILLGVVLGSLWILGGQRFSAAVFNEIPTMNLFSLIAKLMLAVILFMLFRRMQAHTNNGLVVQLGLMAILALMLLSIRFFDESTYPAAIALISDMVRYLVVLFFLLTVTTFASKSCIQPEFLFSAGWIPYAIVFSINIVISEHLSLGNTLVDSFLINTALMVAAVSLLILSIRTNENLGSASQKNDQHSVSYVDFIDERCESVAGDRGLTPRELEVLQFICKGRSKHYISDRLFISENTVRYHTKNLYIKLGVNNRQDLLSLIGVD